MTGLNDLQRTKLSQKGEDYLAAVTRNSGGPRAFRERKRSEAHALLALDLISSRLTVQSIDLESDLRAVLRLQVPVPCRDLSGEFHVAHAAWLGLRYPREAMIQPMPGAAFVQLLQPSTCWHPNVHCPPAQVVCLAARIPPGIRVSELVLMTYRALSMQECTFDSEDPAGVFRADAARWWQAHADRMPLTTAAFLTPPMGPDADPLDRSGELTGRQS